MPNDIIGYIIAFVIFIIGCVKCEWFIKSPRQFSDIHIDHIIDNIYLGNWRDSIDEAKLKYNNIRCILTLNKNKEHTETDRNMFARLGIRYKYIRIQDSLDANILPYIDESIKFIKECDGNVLIHCFAGISRSVSIVVAYLMKEKQMSYNDSIRYVRNIRSIANPNYSFVQQLKSLK